MHARALREADVVVSVARRLHERRPPGRGPTRSTRRTAVEEGRFDREPDPNPALADPVFWRTSLPRADRSQATTGRSRTGSTTRCFDATARLRPDWSFVLIGPDHDGSLARSGVETLQNVHALGPRTYLGAAGCWRRFDVATIPSA